MRRVLNVFLGILFLQMFAIIALAQQDKLAGRWEGKIQSMQGERPTTATFKKEGDGYSGSIVAMQRDLPLKDIKVEGDKVTAIAQVDTPQATIEIKYSFTLSGDTMKGKGELEFGGNPVTFDIELKRAAEGSAPAAPAQQAAAPAPRQQRAQVPQPQQKQSADYFVGQWTFKYIGRESALGLAPREGTMTVTKNADGKTLEARTTGKAESGAFQESATIVWDEVTKMLTYAEKLSTGVKLQSKADWNSPISIRFTIDPVKVKGQTLQLRRTITVIAAHSFSVTEELSEDGGPFIRLGNAVYTKVGAAGGSN